MYQKIWECIILWKRFTFEKWFESLSDSPFKLFFGNIWTLDSIINIFTCSTSPDSLFIRILRFPCTHVERENDLKFICETQYLIRIFYGIFSSTVKNILFPSAKQNIKNIKNEMNGEYFIHKIKLFCQQNYVFNSFNERWINGICIHNYLRRKAEKHFCTFERWEIWETFNSSVIIRT